VAVKPVGLAALVMLALLPDGSRAQADDSTTRAVGLPWGEVFAPLVADPKEPDFLISYLWIRTDLRNTTVGAVGLGQTFGLMRWPGRKPGEGVQMGLSGAVFAQFDLGTGSKDLLNADYLIGLPVTYHRGAFSARARWYHQSSHLGDAYVLRTQPQPQRVNLAFDALEVLLAGEVGPFRAYGGGEYIPWRVPPDLKPGRLHGGLEYRQPGLPLKVGTVARARLVVALDMRSWQQQNWRPGWSARGGLELAPARDDAGLGQRLGLMIHAYDGPSPYGQFYPVEVRSLGFGAHFRL
jgi:hypothetical protein